MRKESKWIWYPGDFEIYHGILQNFSREERGFFWPAYYKIEDCRKHIRFTRSYELLEEETITIYSNCLGYYRINDEKKKFGETVSLLPGKLSFEIFAGAPCGLPSIYIEGKEICSDGSWMADDFVSAPVPVGLNSRYVEKEQNPSIWVYDTEEFLPEDVRGVEGGVLYDFGTELTAQLQVSFPTGFREVTICYGESEREARDVENCYYSQTLYSPEDPVIRRAFRYLFLPGIQKGEVEMKALHQFVDIPVKARFTSSDELMNQIFDVSARTFQLCSGIFFVDGVKRDRWIWSGDAYQSYFVNQYLMFDEEINKRTMWALIGNGPILQHINTIVDYSMYWLISILNHYRMTGDEDFVRAIYPRMKAMMDFLEGQLDGHGFLVGRKDDWIFVDWAEMDKDGAVCAEQMLLLMCYRSMEEAGKITQDCSGNWEEKGRELTANIQRYFWSEEKGAFIDSFSSGRENVTRHGNLFALLFEVAREDQVEKIKKNVLENDLVPQITTPYFKFYELEVLCRLGEWKQVKKMMEDYWGGMLKQGAVTFWEEYDPSKKPGEQYEMYGDPYGKSLCHAWAASPIYLLGRYFVGLWPTADGYASFVVAPQLDSFEKLDCTFPVKGGSVQVAWDSKEIWVKSSVEGGSLRLGERELPLRAGEVHREAR